MAKTKKKIVKVLALGGGQTTFVAYESALITSNSQENIYIYEGFEPWQ
jgi:hypothetical protein